MFSETHLTRLGQQKFRSGLRALRSPYKGVVMGAPCPERKSADAGVYSGVTLLFKGAARALPSNFPDSYRQARYQAAGMMAGNVWLQVGMIYGYPTGHTHKQPAVQTDQILEHLVDRIGCQTTGLRIVCGDVNHEVQELRQLQRLQSLGFREAQDCALAKWGQPITATGRGSRKLDQVWLSPELLPFVQAVVVQKDRWEGHATVVVHLHTQDAPLHSLVWPQPNGLQWPKDWTSKVQWEADANPTTEYARVWGQLEKDAVHSLIDQNLPWTHSQMGRGQTIKPRKVV